MKKVIFSLGITALLIGGSFIIKDTQQSQPSKDSKVVNVAAGEKEPKLFSTYSVSFYSFEI